LKVGVRHNKKRFAFFGGRATTTGLRFSEGKLTCPVGTG